MEGRPHLDQDCGDMHILGPLFNFNLIQDLEDGAALGLGAEGLGIGSGTQWISLSFLPVANLKKSPFSAFDYAFDFREQGASAVSTFFDKKMCSGNGDCI